MDLIKIGQFLRGLRNEKKLTQEQLGEILGVTNKTISRWENGNYLPSVEMLQLLSEYYSVSINELLAGERLVEDNYKEKAEENIKSILSESAFSLKDRVEFFKKKWKKENFFSVMLISVVISALLIIGIIMDNGLWIIAIAGACGYGLLQYNRMMAYVEKHAYDGAGKEND